MQNENSEAKANQTIAARDCEARLVDLENRTAKIEQSLLLEGGQIVNQLSGLLRL